MECNAASTAVAATEVVQQTAAAAGDAYPMMPPAAVPLPPELCRLANFEIEKKIGRGQFSTVFRARCQSSRTIVALKKVQVGNFHCNFIVLIFMHQMTVHKEHAKE